MTHTNSKKNDEEIALATKLWAGRIQDIHLHQMRLLIEEHGLLPSAGDVQLLESRLYVTHAGLLGIARRNKCNGIQTEVVSELSDPRTGRWIVRATVFKTVRSKGFVGYGDADPNNVSSLVRGAELRVAETRAVNRALRKAYGIGLCSVEELGCQDTRIAARQAPYENSNDRNGDRPARLRDRLLVLIRQHRLDGEQVKQYALHFCGTETLREASRQQIESLINHLTMLGAQGRDQLLAELNSVCSQQKCPAAAANSAAEIEESKEAA